jgi:hypothetical protein
LIIFGFGLREVKFFCATTVMFITLHIGVRQRPAYHSQVGSIQVCADYASEFNWNVRIKYCAKQVIDLPSENLKKKGANFKLIYQFSELNFKLWLWLWFFRAFSSVLRQMPG